LVRSGSRYTWDALYGNADSPSLLISVGGQMMGGMASRSLKLENGDGTSFYEFEDIDSANNFITEWYQKLNELDLTEDQKQEVVDEANFVFALNIDILQELEGSPLKALLTLAISSLKAKLGFA
jgi:heme oxygenase